MGRWICAAVLWAGMASAGAAGEGESPAVLRQVLLEPREGVYVASFPDLGGSEDDVSVEKIKDYEKLVGKGTAWVYFSNNWYDGIEFPAADVATIYEAGSVPYVRLMARSRGRKGGGDPVYTMDALAGGKFDEDLRRWARGARDVGREMLAEFGTEVNGSWFPWNGKWNGAGEKTGYGDGDVADGPERFRDAFRRIVRICREEGANNITWFFHIDASRSPREEWNTMAAYYPGDEYIDWIGVSVFGSQRAGREWVIFTEKFDRAYAEMEAISARRPMAVVEYAVVEDPESGSKAAWIRDALGAVRKGRYPRIKAVSYWHESWGQGERRVELRVDSSAEALAAYRETVAEEFFVEKLRFGVVPAGAGN